VGEKNNNGMVWLIILFVLLGVLISFQMKLNIDDYDLVTLKNLQTMKNDSNNMRKEIEDLKGLIENRKKELAKLESVIKDDEGDISIHLMDEIKKLKLIAGLDDAQGPGIMLLIDDNQEEEIVGWGIEDDIVHDADIQVILNDLRKAGAEAISINGQRVMSKSEVKCGGSIIRVNGRSSAPPFVIKAIGDPKLLYAAISAPNTYGWIMKEVRLLRFEAMTKDNISVPKYYWAEQDFKYSKQKEEGE